jgi:dihydropteroate synthase
VVGVVNVTPDSFSDGGRYLAFDAACAHVDRLLAEGADIVEIGGESTRPAGAVYGQGHAPVDAATQIARTRPVVAYAAQHCRVAIDTMSAEVAAAALDAGATVVNDVGLAPDPELPRVCAERGAWLVLMHARPGARSSYDDLAADVLREWRASRDRAVAAGVPPDRILFDPGIGFGKDAPQNFALLGALPRLAREVGAEHPIYVGASRKAFIGAAEERDGLERSAPDARTGGTLAASLWAARAGAAVLRVHDVRALRQALAVETAIGLAAEPQEAG